MARPSRLASALTLLSQLSLLSVGDGCVTWRSATREAVLDFARQPNVDHRILTALGTPDRIPIDADARLRIHTATGVVGSFASRDLQFENGSLQFQPEGKPPVQLQPSEIQWAELQRSDDGVTSWIMVPRESLVDLATQHNVAHRVLGIPTEPEKIAINGDTTVRIHTTDGVKAPVPSGYLHANGEELQVASPSGPPKRVDPLSADFRVPDDKATIGLVLGITIPVALFLAAGLAFAAASKGFGSGGLLCPPGTPCGF